MGGLMSLLEELTVLDELATDTNEKIISVKQELKSAEPGLSSYIDSLVMDGQFGSRLKEIHELVKSDYFKVKDELELMGLNNKLKPWRELIGLSTKDINKMIQELIKSLDESNHFKKAMSFRICPECSNYEDFHKGEGAITCKACGLELEKDFVSQERPAFTKEEISNRRRTEKVWRGFGCRTMMSGSKDARGNELNNTVKNTFKRLSRINRSLTSSLERNFWEAKPKMKKVKNVPEHVRDLAWKIYSECAKRKLTMGRSINGFICTSIYVAMRCSEESKPLSQLIRDFEAIYPNQKVVLNKLYPYTHLMMKKGVLKQFGLNYSPPHPIEVAKSVCAQLNLKGNVTKYITNCIKLLKKSTGKSPQGIISGALYVTLKNLNLCEDKNIINEFRKHLSDKLLKKIVNKKREPKITKITQEIIADYCNVTEVTLRTRVREIKNGIKRYKSWKQKQNL